MYLKHDNMADRHLVVGSLEVLGDVQSSGMKTIKRNMDALTTSVQTVAAAQRNYWSELADDSIITPEEKQTLHREWNTIVQTYTAIMEDAGAKELLNLDGIKSFDSTFQNLRNYLFGTVKIFDSMQENSSIDPDLFKKFFSDYYYSQSKAQNILAFSAASAVRTLTNLDSPGYDGEVALYSNRLYRWSSVYNKWEEVAADQYQGPLAYFPAPVIGNYFLATEEKTLAYLHVNGRPLMVNGKPLKADVAMGEGYIFVYTEHGWEKIVDRNNWRYIMASNDLTASGYDLSPSLLAVMQHTAQTSVHIPKYLKVRLEIPQEGTYGHGDWFVWGADSTEKFIRGKAYINNADGIWSLIDANDSAYNTQLLTALTDMIDVMGGSSDGYFQTVFAKKLFAMEAVINELQTKVITLTEGGVIKSNGYVPGAKFSGFSLNSSGDFYCTNGSFFNMHAEKAFIKGRIEATEGSFSGEIESGPLYLKNTNPTDASLSFSWEIGTDVSVIYQTLVDTGYIGFSGKYGDSDFNLIILEYIQFPTSAGPIPIPVYHIQNNNNILYSYSVGDIKSHKSISIKFFNENAKTLKLLNLPTTSAAGKDVVWKDSSGYLRIGL